MEYENSRDEARRTLERDRSLSSLSFFSTAYLLFVSRFSFTRREADVKVERG